MDSKNAFELELLDRERNAARFWDHLNGAGWLVEAEAARDELRRSQD